MATATSPVPDDRSSKRQKGDENGSSSQGGENMYPSRPPQHPSQMYAPGYMGMGGGGPGPGPYMGGTGMPPYGQYGNPHGPPPPPPPPPHAGGVYGGMYGGGGPPPPPPPVRGHGSPERSGRPGGPWSGYRGGPPHGSNSGGGPPHGGKKDESGPPPPPTPQQQHPPGQHPYPPGAGWGHPQSWQPGHPYGPPPPGYPGAHPSMPGMYSQGAAGPSGGWTSSGGGGATSPSEPANGRGPSSSVSSKSPSRNRPRPESATPDSRQPPTQPPPPRNDNSMYCLDINSVQGGRMSVTHDYGEEGSSVSGSNKDKGRGSYKCGRCGVPKKGHICPYQPKLKRRPDEPPPETRNAAVQVEMDEFMTLRRLNIRIQGFPESYATEPFLGASMVGAEPHPHESYVPPGPPPVDTGTMMPMDDIYSSNSGGHHHHHHSSSSNNNLTMIGSHGRPPAPESADEPDDDMDKDRAEAPPQENNSSPPKPENMETSDEDGDPTEKEEKQAMV
ncbi:hypothetical protein ACA910_003083 [Epithemia clementina (nom. ined.)]